MRNLWRVVCCAAFWCFAAAPQMKSQDVNFLTIYQNDCAMVKTTYTSKVPEGTSTASLDNIPALIDPASVVVTAQNPDVQVSQVAYVAPDIQQGEMSLQRHHIGKSVQVAIRDFQTVTGILHSLNQDELVLREEDGAFRTIRRDAILFIRYTSLDAGVGKPVLQFSVTAPKAGEYAFTVQYLTSGLNWQARYIGLLSTDERTITTFPKAVITNQCGLSFKSARLHLVSGNVQRYAQPPMMMMKGMAEAYDARMAQAPALPEQEAVSEYYSFIVSYMVELQHGASLTFPLADARKLTVIPRYFYRTYDQGNGVRIGYEWTNSKRDGFGVPMPGGMFMLQQNLEQGFSTFLGEDRIPVMPLDRKADIITGTASDIIGTHEIMASRTPGPRTREVDVAVSIVNSKSNSVVVVIQERPDMPNWSIENASHAWERKHAGLIELPVEVAPGGTTDVRFTIRYAH